MKRKQKKTIKDIAPWIKDFLEKSGLSMRDLEKKK